MKKKKISWDKNLIKVICVAMIISLAYSFSSHKITFLNILSLKTADLFNRLTYQLKPKPKELKEISLVVIDDESFMVLQKKWPWSRSFLSEFIDNLNEYRPKIISLDMVFTGESNNKDDDSALAEAIKNAGNVILASYIAPDKSYNEPYLPLQKAALGFGFVNKTRDKDLTVRNCRLLFPRKDLPGILKTSFGLKTFLRYHESDIKNDVSLNNRRMLINLKDVAKTTKQVIIPLSEKGTALINYQAKNKDFEIIPFHKIINKTASKASIHKKIILVGTTAEIFHDVYPTPLGLMPGVVINANEILMYLSGNFLKETPEIFSILLILIVAICTAIFTYKLSILKGSLLLALELLGLMLVSFLLSYQNLSFDYFGPIFIAAFLYLGTETYKYMRLLVEAAILKTMAITDGLTGLFVHRYLILKLDSEFAHAKEENTQLTFLIMDVDHFKKVNDTYGHEEGNVILKNVARIIQESSRRVDVVARYGGEEFCCILPNTTAKGASIYAERLRKSIEEFNFPYKGNQPLKVTISIGIASLTETDAQTPKELISFADKALYKAKETGRNKVCVFLIPERPPTK
ncbi:MAG: diguanylate cyclase [Candidatus Omnitrophica bacterium]|nr:diguanylate cyclase [Candidatus Omnitrophota bacterium]